MPGAEGHINQDTLGSCFTFISDDYAGLLEFKPYHDVTVVCL